MPNDILIKYATSTTLTASLASLGTDTSLLAGIESSAIDNRTNGYDDYLVSGKITTGTTPTTGRQIEVWAVAWDGNAWPDVFDGTSSSATITSAEIKTSICKPVAILPTNATSNQTYPFTGVSLKQVFGGALPSQCVLFVVHNTAVSLNATAGNHELRIQGVYPQVQ
jgi:hypothetical protein